MSEVARLLAEMGDNAARRQMQRGQLVAGAVQSLANAPGAILQMREQERIQQAQIARANAQATYAQRTDARAQKDQAMQDATDAAHLKDQADSRAVMAAVYQPDGTMNYERGFAKAAELGRLDLGDALKAHAKTNAPKLTSGAPGSVMRDEAGQVVPGSEIPAAPPAIGTPGHEIVLRQQALLTPPAAAPDFVGPQNQPMTPEAAALQAYSDQRAATLTPKAPELGSFGDYLGRYAASKGIEPSKLKPADVEAARKAYQQSDDRPRVNVSVGGAGGHGDVKESIAGMKDGTLPPLLPGRASKDYTAIMAEAHRQGYDIARAATDWTATQKHVATMNGAQQLRLNQAINALPEMLDNVDSLATQWKGGRFPTLNKISLAAAKGGAYGKEAASIANQLDAQIADVTADLGNVYMGGNSPTDHALGLAGKSLKGEWDEKVLHDMVALAKKNVVIRRNSIANTGVAGASATNPYGTQGGAPNDGEAPAAGKPIKVGGFTVVVK